MAPAVDRVRISPAGDRVLAIASGEGKRGLAVIELATGELRVALQPDAKSTFIDSCNWASNERIVCSMYVFPRDAGVQSPKTAGAGWPYPRRRLIRLVAVDHDGGNPVELVGRPPRKSPLFAGVARVPFRHPLDDMEHVVVHHLPADPRHVLVAAPREATPYTSVYRVDIRNGKPTRVAGFEFGIILWHADQAGKVRLGTGWYEFGTPPGSMQGRQPEEPWIGPTAVAADGEGGFGRIDVKDLSGPVGVHDLAGPHILGFSQDGGHVYYEARVKGADRTAVWEADAETLGPLRQLVADERQDVRASAIAGRRCGVVGFMHPLPGRPFTWLDPAFGRDVAAAANHISAEVVAVTSLSADCRRLVLVAADGYARRSFHLVDRADGTLRDLGEQHPGIRGNAPVERRIVSYSTRDDMQLPMAVTLPKAAATPPVVMILDGGPGRASDDPLNTWPHFFASRGYAVAQPVFRGAKSHGAALHQAGMRQRGAKLQTDVADALAWLAAAGLANAARVCFVGRGKGGHLALAAALGEPPPGEDGRCVAAFAVMDMASTKRDHRGPYRGCTIHPCDDWMSWAAPDRLRSNLGVSRLGPANAASRLRSPVVDAKHPGFPVLIQSGGKAIVHERGSKRFKADLEALGFFDYIAPVGSTAEAEFLVAAADLFDRVLKGREAPR